MGPATEKVEDRANPMWNYNDRIIKGEESWSDLGLHRNMQ